MTKLPGFFLAVSLTAFAVGAVVCFGNLNVHPSWAVAVPTGAIFFGMFLNAYMLQGEAVKFDEEAAKRGRLAVSKEPQSVTSQIGEYFPTDVFGVPFYSLVLSPKTEIVSGARRC
jgi:hypothetical protein